MLSMRFDADASKRFWQHFSGRVKSKEQIYA
jgi:hypothetical protein